MKWVLMVCALLAAGSAAAQKYPERRVIRSGNRAYEKGEWQAAEGRYRSALERAPESREAAFNLGSVLFKQEKWSEAAAAFEGVVAMDAQAAVAGDARALGAAGQALYGQGTALARERKLQEALETLKNAMRADPADQDAKFNYAYVKKLLEGEQGEGGGGGGDNDRNQDRQDKQDQQGDQNQEGQDDQNQQDRNGEDDQNQEGENGEQSGQNGEDDQNRDGENRNGEGSAQGGMTREEAERMLQAMQAQEDQTQEKINGQRQTVVVGRSGKNW